MKFRDIIAEDGDAAATVAADIATVAFPLFTKGRNQREKFRAGRRAVGMKGAPTKSYVGKGVYEGHATEAHVLERDDVIYRLDKDNPMDDTEVLVIGGAGRYTLKSLRDKARKEALALAQDLEAEHGGAFRRSSENIRQLTNTLNTIVAAYNQLERIRQRGGRGSRGIRREHVEVVQECITVLERACHRQKMQEGTDVDPMGYDEVSDSGNLIHWPQGTTLVKVSDVYDWYKLGQVVSDLDKADPAKFGKGPPETILVFGSEDEEHKLIPHLKRLGMRLTDVDDPVDEAYRASDLIKYFEKETSK